MLFIGQRKAILGRRSLAQQVAALFAASEQGAWYDPSDLTSMSQTSGGTVGNVAVGDPVGKILDKSGRGNHATQGTSASRPILQQDADGRYYLQFDGFDDFLVTAAINFTATDKMTVWSGLGGMDAASSGMIAELSANADSNAGCFYLYKSTSVLQTQLVGSAIAKLASPASATDGNQKVVRSAFDIAGATIATEIVSALNQSTTGWTTVVVGPAGTGSFGNYALYIGRRGGSTLPYQHRIYGLIFRGASSTAAQIATGEQYINSKAGAY